MWQYNNELYHYGVLGMKWGHRKSYPSTLTLNSSDSSVTKKVKSNYNTMTDSQFKNKYKGSKNTYAKRVEKYGDPYMKSPLAKMGKAMVKANATATKSVLTNQEKKGPINAKYTKIDRLRDQHKYGTRGVRNIGKRMDRGESYTKASIKESGKNIAIKSSIALASLDALSGGTIHRAGIQAVSKILASEKAKQSIIKIAANPKYNPIDVAYEILN